MRAALITAPGSPFHIDDIVEPAPGRDDLVLRVTGCGVCGSDLKARPAMEAGTVMGHELCGEVVAVGADAAGVWSEGMRAAVLPVFSCGRCDHCRLGDVAHCRAAQLIGLGGASGGFAELIRVSAALSFPIPDSVPLSWGPLVEPFAVGLHTARAAEIAAGDRVLVIGGGSVGITTAAWSSLLGATAITVSDPLGARRVAAIGFGATDVIDPTDQALGGPYDVVIDCVGKPGLLDACANVADTHGRIVIAGVCAELDPYLPLVPLMKELNIRFSVYYRPEEFRTVIEAFADGRIDPSPLVTRTVGLGDLDEVFASLAHPQTSSADLKVVVDPTR